ncbi:MAG: hypothetical protein DRI01_09980 [Chloroflexi bacterium]|nr:MAG: hypothetical protein DRI01_09980 [Chloroflexota bacterium]
MRKFLAIAIVVFLFSFPSFAEEKKETNWELKAYQNELRALKAEVELGFTAMILRRIRDASVSDQVRKRMEWLEEKIKELEKAEKQTTE